MPHRAALLAAFLGAAATPLAAQQPGVDVRAYHFDIDLPDTGNVIHGMATIYFEPRAGYDDTLRLDLVGMTVRAVYDVETMNALPFSYDGRVLKVALTMRAARAGGRLATGVVTVRYEGAPSDGLIATTNAQGRRAFFGDNWPNRARYWLPTVDHPSDKARVMWSVRGPAGWRVVTNAPQCLPARTARPGCLESAPIPTYTMVLGAGPMSVSRHRAARVGGDTIPIEVWAWPEDSAFADNVPLRRATEIVETMSRIVGPFPYAKLAHVEGATRYGGMENATAIFYDEHAYVRRSMREGVVRHETAHQWFGDAVTERDWHHLWLSEGFASYFDLVIGAALDGDSVLKIGMRNNAESWMRSDVVNRPVIDTAEPDPNKLLNANVYPKGAWVLHMLRETVGDSAFFSGIREYYRAYRDSAVLTGQFQAVMERAASQPLDWFFGQWLWQPGYPQLDVEWRADSAEHRVVLDVLQTEPAAWGRFRIPVVPVEFRRAGRVVGRRTFQLMPQATSQSLTFVLDEMPDAVVVDPEGTLLLTARVRN